MIMVGGLSAKGEAFAERMKADDRAGRSNRLKFALETEALCDGVSWGGRWRARLAARFLSKHHRVGILRMP